MIIPEKLIITLRKVSKNNYWQTVYASSKDLKLQLFVNIYNFTSIQIAFLNYLSFYNSLYLDIAMGDVEERVLNDNLYEDAYMYYRNKMRVKHEETQKNIGKFQPSGGKLTETSKDEWVFKKPDESKGIIRHGRN